MMEIKVYRKRWINKIKGFFNWLFDTPNWSKSAQIFEQNGFGKISPFLALRLDMTSKIMKINELYWWRYYGRR